MPMLSYTKYCDLKWNNKIFCGYFYIKNILFCIKIYIKHGYILSKSSVCEHRAALFTVGNSSMQFQKRYLVADRTYILAFNLFIYF